MSEHYHNIDLEKMECVEVGDTLSFSIFGEIFTITDLLPPMKIGEKVMQRSVIVESGNGFKSKSFINHQFLLMINNGLVSRVNLASL